MTQMILIGLVLVVWAITLRMVMGNKEKKGMKIAMVLAALFMTFASVNTIASEASEIDEVVYADPRPEDLYQGVCVPVLSDTEEAQKVKDRNEARYKELTENICPRLEKELDEKYGEQYPRG